jgi:hypothetical protein
VVFSKKKFAAGAMNFRETVPISVFLRKTVTAAMIFKKICRWRG